MQVLAVDRRKHASKVVLSDPFTRRTCVSGLVYPPLVVDHARPFFFFLGHISCHVPPLHNTSRSSRESRVCLSDKPRQEFQRPIMRQQSSSGVGCCFGGVSRAPGIGEVAYHEVVKLANLDVDGREGILHATQYT